MEMPKKIHCTSVEFSEENGTLTPSFKLKRGDARTMHYDVIKEMYDNAVLQGEE